MLEFTDPFKIYLFKHKQEVKLSIMVTSSLVDTYTMSQRAFEQLLAACVNSKGASVEDKISWWAQHKHIGRPTEYVRLSAWHSGMSRDYRTDKQIIDQLITEYERQKNNVMYWDQP